MAAHCLYLNCSILLICVCAFTEVIAVEMTYELRHSFAEKINYKRSKPGPPAQTMSFLEWSNELETMAQQRAEECNIATQGPNEIGESKGLITEPDKDPASVVDQWAAEAQKYDFTNNKCSGICENYRQMLNAVSSKVGCGISDCSGTIYVYCHYEYKLPSYFNPYQAATSEFSCDSGKTENQRLCHNDPPCPTESCTGNEEQDEYCICYQPESDATTVADEGETTVGDVEPKTEPAGCGTKKCENGEILNENCECYCPEGDTCGTEEENRNGAATTGLQMPLLALVVCLFTLFS